MTVQFPPLAPSLPGDLPTPADAIRADGWTPARQRRFLETLAATGVIMLACESVRITTRSAYNLRIRHDGAAFRLGWDAAILIARDRLATDLLSRAICGQEEVIRRDPDTDEIRRHRHDNRLAMSMLARLDRMADAPAEGSDAALARIVAQDFVAYLDMICPEDAVRAEVARDGLPRAGHEPSARTMADAQTLLGERPDDPEPVEAQGATVLAPAASVAMFIAVRRNLLSSTAHGGRGSQKPRFPVDDERCELPPQVFPPLRATLPPEQAAAQLRGVFYDDDLGLWRTDFPPPPGFAGDQTEDIYDIDDYERDLTAEEDAALAQRDEEERRPYEDAAARARDAYFGFAPGGFTGRMDLDDAIDPAACPTAAPG